MLINSNIISRFWSKVNKTDSCWLWTAGTERRGYGHYWLNGKTIKAHRYSYSLTNGPIPSNMVICHTCDNPSCVNPDHLFLGTTLDNIQDRQSKNRQAKGSKSSKSKLNATQVLEIRNLYATTNTTCKELANKYNVSDNAIRLIIVRRNWKHI